jgi:hypothetical protein
MINNLLEENKRLRRQKQKYHKLYLNQIGYFCEACGKFIRPTEEKCLDFENIALCMKCFDGELK